MQQQVSKNKKLMEELKFLKEEIQGLKSLQNEHIYNANNNTSIMNTSIRNFKQQQSEQTRTRALE